jgi:hypothetical protein
MSSHVARQLIFHIFIHDHKLRCDKCAGTETRSWTEIKFTVNTCIAYICNLKKDKVLRMAALGGNTNGTLWLN